MSIKNLYLQYNQKIIKFPTPTKIQVNVSTVFVGIWTNFIISSVIAFFPFGVFLSIVGGFTSTYFLQKDLLRKFPEILRQKNKITRQIFNKYKKYQYLSSIFLVSLLSAYISLLVFYINLGEVYEQSWLQITFFDELFRYSPTFRWIYSVISFGFATGFNLTGCWLAFILRVGIPTEEDEQIMKEMNVQELQEYLETY